MNAPHDWPAALAPRWRQDTLQHGLGPAFHTALPGQALPDVHWVARSDALAAELGLAGWLAGDEALAVLSGNAAPSHGTPLATVYSGHQFGVWAGQLGDGRALLLGELQACIGGSNLVLHGERPGLQLPSGNLHIGYCRRYFVRIAIKQGQGNSQRCSHDLVFIVELIHRTKGNIRNPVCPRKAKFRFLGGHSQTGGLVVRPPLQGTGREFLW